MNNRPLIKAQLEGEPLILTDEIQVDPMPPALGVVEANFDFYVDGYTMKSTEKIGEILVTGPQGNTVTVKSSVLTGFLERRLSPPNIMPLQDDLEGRN